jgi:hypothetical protein
VNITGCNRLINGGTVTWSGTGLTMDISPAYYSINCIYYQSAAAQVTLAAADPTHPRFDVIAANTSGTIIVLTGTAAATPVKPQVDPATQLELTTILVTAGATTPGVTQIVVYDENAEWTTASSLFSGSVDFDNTTTPFHGTKNARMVTGTAGTLTFTDATAHNLHEYTSLKIYVRLTGPETPYTMAVALLNNGASITTGVDLRDHGLNISILNAWQPVTIPMSVFTASSAADAFDGIAIKVPVTPYAVQLDYIQFQGGIGSGSSPYITDVFRKPGTDSVFQVKNNLPQFAFIDSVGSGGGGTPAGSNRQVQYNNSGSFGGAAGVEIGNTNNRLLVQAQASTEIPIIGKGAASQSANLLSLRNSADAQQFGVTADGQVSLMGGAASFNRLLFGAPGLHTQISAGERWSVHDNGPSGAILNLTTGSYPSYNNSTFYFNCGVVINDDGAVQDFRVEGDTDPNLLITKASTDRVGIGTSSPSEKLHVNGNLIASAPPYTSGGFEILARNATSGRFETVGSLTSEGSYTPTLTNTTNVAASTAYTLYWSLNGTKLTIWGEVDIDPTSASTLTVLGISLPTGFAICFSSTNDLAGTAADDLNTVARIRADTTNNRAELRMTPTDVSNRRFSIHFTVHIEPC